MTDDKLYTSLSANAIMAKLTNHFQQTRLICKTSSTDKHYSLDSADDFGLGCRNVSHQQQFFQNYPHLDNHTIPTIILPKGTLHLQSHKLSLCFWQIRLQCFCLSSHPLIVAFQAGYLLLKLLLFFFHSFVFVSINILVLFCQLVDFCRPTNNLQQ